MASVNKVILMGNLGKDPEVRFMPNGDAVCNFSIATTDNWKDKNGEKQERTEWHNIVMWRGLADVAQKYLTKGKLVYIEGKLRTRSYEDKEGHKRYSTEVVAESFKLLGRNSDFEPKTTNSTTVEAEEKEEIVEAYKKDINEDDLPF